MSDLRDQAHRDRRPALPHGALGTALKLLFACLAVGFVLTVLRIDPVGL